MDERYTVKATNKETDDYSWMQRTEPQWKGLVYKDLFQRFLLTYPFAVLATPIFQRRNINIKNAVMFSTVDKFQPNKDFLKELKVKPFKMENILQ